MPAGELGDLIVRGDSICAGYWNRPEQTRHTITGDSIRTGDKFRRDDDGFFWFAGQSDDMLKVGGIWSVRRKLNMSCSTSSCPGLRGNRPENQDGLDRAHAVS